MRIGPRAARAACLILGLLAARTAWSQTVVRPVQPRVFHAPTAWLQPDGAVYGTAGLSHHLAPFVGVSAGLGGVAELDVQLTDTSKGQSIPTALFKMGIAARRIGAWQPAMALGFRKSFAVRAQELGGAGGTSGSTVHVRTAQLSLAVSMTVGSVDVHLGTDAWGAEVENDLGAGVAGARLSDRPLRERLRPFAGLEWRPNIYPRTAVLVDFVWVPDFTGTDASSPSVALRWVGGWGIRYQALSWGAVELGVRLREGDGLGDPTVLVRLSGFFGPR